MLLNVFYSDNVSIYGRFYKDMCIYDIQVVWSPTHQMTLYGA